MPSPPHPHPHACTFSQVLGRIFNPAGDFLEYLENGLEILEFVTVFQPPGPPAGPAEVAAAKAAAAAGMAPYVEMLPLVAHAFHNWAYDYIPNMVTPIDNMIGNATDLFLAGVEPTSGTSYLGLVLGMAEKVRKGGRWEASRVKTTFHPLAFSPPPTRLSLSSWIDLALHLTAPHSLPPFFFFCLLALP